MAYRDILLPLFTYPSVPPDTALATAALMARRLQVSAPSGEVAALAFEAQLRASTNQLANLLARLDRAVEEENRRCARAASEALQSWRSAAAGQGLKTRAWLEQVDVFTQHDVLEGLARTHDICLFAMDPGVGVDQTAAEVVLFGSGRPILAFPYEVERPHLQSFAHIVIAWDGSRAAARALADAMPLIAASGKVQVLSVLDEKPALLAGQWRGVLNHLARHDVKAEVVELRSGGAAIGHVLRTFAREAGADLLVMGGFGHGRMRQFLLGGATSSLLRDPGMPVLLSH